MLKSLFKIIAFSFFIFTKQVFSLNFTKETNELIQQVREEYQISSLSLSISVSGQNDQYNFYSGTYFQNDDRKLNSTSLYKVGSITKTFTAEIINQLISKSKIKLDDKLIKWFPEYPNWSEITVRDLLNSTSGIQDYINAENWWDDLFEKPTKIWTEDELLKISYESSLKFKPGTQWDYSNTNYILLGTIIEKITNKKITDYYNKIFMNNNLKQTFYITENPPLFIMQDLVHGYLSNQKDMTNINTSWVQSAGALYSNPKNLTMWFESLLINKISLYRHEFYENQFISINNAKTLKNFDDIGYSSGLFTMPTPIGILWFTPGNMPGYLSLTGMFPCSGIIFSYSISTMPKKLGIHPFIIDKLVRIFKNDTTINEKIKKYTNRNKLPEFCQKESKPLKTIFPDF